MGCIYCTVEKPLSAISAIRPSLFAAEFGYWLLEFRKPRWHKEIYKICLLRAKG